MNEDFVTFELAKKLKEKGFDKECFAHYDDLGNLLLDKDYWKLDSHILAPTIYQVLKWLREEKKIHIIIPASFDEDYWWESRDFNKEISEYADEEYKSYEQAAIAGIEYVLDNLI